MKTIVMMNNIEFECIPTDDQIVAPTERINRNNIFPQNNVAIAATHNGNIQ